MINTILHRRFLLLASLVLLAGSCEKEGMDATTLQGKVISLGSDRGIYPAYLILDDVLLTITSDDGSYEITTLDPGVYELICSSIGYEDLVSLVEIREGSKLTQDFLLTPGSQTGTVYGELHDQGLYDECLLKNPEMADWTDKELFDGISGATIQSKTLGHSQPPSHIYIGDSLVIQSDEYGQYNFDIQSGTYPIRVSCPGYEDSMKMVSVVPDISVFGNFILPVEQ